MTHGLVHLRVTDFDELAAVVRAFRAATSYSVREIREALNAKEPLRVAQLFAADHNRCNASLQSLLLNLNRVGATVEILVDNRVETRQFLENSLKRWEEVRVQIELESDLESGEPSIKSLMELKRRCSPEVYSATLNQIMNSDGWVWRELGKA